jgi:zinc transport system substrate-binding protein
MKKSHIIALVIAILFIGLLIGLTFTANKQNNKIKVVTTLFPLYDIAKSIGNDKAEVTLLLPPGVEAHSFEPSPSDIVKINESDIFVYAGEFMEPWVADIISSMTDNSTIIIDASKGIKLNNKANNQQPDPHFWLDFTNIIKVSSAFSRAITTKDMENKEYYRANSSTYTSLLNTLDRDFRRGLSKCELNNVIYAGHSAFGYLENKYHVSFVNAFGVAPNAEASAQNIANLVDQIKKDSIKYVYYEKILGSQLAQTIADETGASILPLNPADNITKDEFDNNASFDSIMRSNLENLKIGLLCK